MQSKQKGFTPLEILNSDGQNSIQVKKHLLRKSLTGFTLIELLVVIAIIGLLSTLAVVALTSARAKARDAKRISDVKQVQTALELYFADQGQQYPVGNGIALGVGDNLVLCSAGIKKTLSETDCGKGFSTFMGKLPKDPNNPADSKLCGEGAEAICNYKYVGKGATYSIDFSLEGKSGDLGKGSNCATQDGMNIGACASAAAPAEAPAPGA